MTAPASFALGALIAHTGGPAYRAESPPRGALCFWATRKAIEGWGSPDARTKFW